MVSEGVSWLAYDVIGLLKTRLLAYPQMAYWTSDATALALNTW